MKSLIKLDYRKVFFFLLLIPISFLAYEIRETHRYTREAQEEVFLLNTQRASNQRTIMGLQVRILHYVEGHSEDETVGMCPLCFKNMLLERYDHELIRKFLRENGVDAQSYLDGELSEEELSFISSSSVTKKDEARE